MFRAARVKQTLIHGSPDVGGYDGPVEYRDLDDGAAFGCTVAVSGDTIPWPDGKMQDGKGRMRFEYPEEFHVEFHEVLPSHFDYTLAAMTRLFEASVKTGNPVRWS